jgi:hypothetical protein
MLERVQSHCTHQENKRTTTAPAPSHITHHTSNHQTIAGTSAGDNGDDDKARQGRGHGGMVWSGVMRCVVAWVE